MMEALEATLDDFGQGRLSRRDALARLTAVMLTVAGSSGLGRSQEPAAGTFAATGLDHIALRVTDLDRSRDFYVRHLGLRVRSEGRSNCFLGCGRNFVALFRSTEPGLDHYAYRIDDYSASDAVARLERAGLRPHREENRVYFEDPDGITVQVSGP